MADTLKPAAIQRAHHQLEMLLKPGGSSGAFAIQDELERCWASLKEDPTVADPETTMVELSDRFADKFKAAILQEIADDPMESPDELFAEEE